MFSPKRSALQRLWYGRSVRTQLLLAIGAINLLALFVAGTVSILNTRMATRVEVEASLEVAQRFVDATIKDLEKQGRIDRLAEELPLHLKHLRHVRLMLVDSYGNLTVLSPIPADQQWAPAWFKALVAPKLANRSVRVVPGGPEPVIIMGHPADEIAEAWRDFYVLALVWLALNAAVLLVLYLLLGRMLAPLTGLARGLLKLEDGQYATRLAHPKVKEIGTITAQFNALAGALGIARKENSALYRQLITVQEDERREIANELHDEAGPCLFGITANASSIRTLAEQLNDARSPELTQRVGELLSIAERLKLMNRALLKKLRPGPLGHVKLAQLLEEMVSGFQRRHSERSILMSIGNIADSYGETIDLTLYRCVQEGLTHAVREDNARTVLIDLAESGPPPAKAKGKRKGGLLHLTLRDDGIAATPGNFTRAIMTERVRSLGGSFRIGAAEPTGTSIEIEIPVSHGAKGARPRRRATPELDLAEMAQP